MGRLRTSYGPCLALAIVTFVACGRDGSRIPEDALLVRHGTVIDGTGAPPIVDGVVVVQGDRILAIGEAAGFNIPEGVRIIDAGGGTVLPGIVDAHTHSTHGASIRRTFLVDGVTTVCNLGTSLDRLSQFAEGSVDVSDEPLVEIGVLDGDPNYQLFRVVGALRLSDGRLVVANSGTNELRFYDSSGRYLRSSGRKGGGPGEFEGLSWLGASGADSLLAYDWPGRQISVFDAAGEYARASVLPALSHAPPSHINPVSLSDGSLLVGAQRFFGSGSLTTGVYEDTIFHLLFDTEGVLVDTIA
ncbi:MAG: hypothetical protein GTN78_04365 [Gemmatimonadales bacterium]|nr:hypothetical protein [Gemmatimonadales bacterium]NIQ99420.1 hypothetical protein [Gemmatimonadales bacterium]NIS64088.1 hypothetical protein [Gemmatimonadales bacterium]